MSRKKRIILTILAVPLVGLLLCVLVGAAAVSSLPIEDGRGHDGTSMSTAIVIQADNEMDGVNYEYIWLSLHHPTDMVVMQSLVTMGGRAYDVIELQSSSGEMQTIYFDITSFYGRW